jgi:type VI secretion system protein ImpJ
VSYTSKILWGEGLFLRPQHFQRQDAYHESRLHHAALSLHPYYWGVRALSFDLDALASGMLRTTQLSVIFPDGEPYSAPGADRLPPAIALDVLPPGQTEFTFYLALPPMKDLGNNSSGPSHQLASTGMARFSDEASSCADLFTNAIDAEVIYLRKNIRLISDSDPRDQLITLPVIRIRRSSAGGFELDTSFVPPIASIEASPAIYQQLRRLLDMLQAKVNSLYGFHREPSKNIIEFRSGDVASFWLLHTVNTAFATLSHLFRQPALHPERLFQELLALAGSLMTFTKAHALTDLPTYDHHNPGPGFTSLDILLRELLDTVISTRYFAIALTETRRSFHVGHLDSGKIDEKTTFYISATSSMPAAELVDAIPMRLKVGAPDDVDKLVLSAMPGVRLGYTPQVPPAIPVQPGACYFLLDSRNPLYERMLQAQSVAVYTPNGIPDLRIELIAVTS